MATPDIAKEALIDPRVLQNPARYAVAKGGQSYTNANFQAISQTTSQHTYNINVPSLQTFVDRAVDWTSTVHIQFVVGITTPFVAGEPVIVYGRDFALCSFPLTQLVNTITAQINDASVSLNTDTVLREVLRLTDYKQNRLVRTCPTMLDVYQNYDDGYLAMNSPLGSYLDASSNEEVPNGAYFDVAFTDATGAPLTVAYSNAISGSGGGNVNVAGGIPVRTVGVNEALGYSVYFKFTSKEKLVLSPFIFADSKEMSTALYSINNIQIVLNMSAVGVNRVIRSTSGAGRVISTSASGKPQYNNSATNGAFVNSTMSMIFISPSLDIELPAKNTISYIDFPRYITSGLETLPAGTSKLYSSQTITLSGVPDMLVIYAKPQDYQTRPTNQADFYLPVEKINLVWSNYAGLLSNHSREELYRISVNNGLNMDYNMWCGRSRSARTGREIPLVGGFLVLKPNTDFACEVGQAPGVQGQITVQFDLTIRNQTSADVVPNIFLIAVQSGFIESLAGSTRVIKSILSEREVLEAPLAEEQTSATLARVVGGSFFGSLGSMLSKAKSLYETTKPIVSAVKGVLPETGTLGKVKSGLSMVGYGQAGGAKTGGRRKLEQRLMM